MHRKKQQQTKRLNEHHVLLVWHFVFSFVCACHILYVLYDDLKSSQGFALFVNTVNVMSLFLFVSFLSPSVFSQSQSVYMAAHCFLCLSPSFFAHSLGPATFMSLICTSPLPSSSSTLSVGVCLSFLWVRAQETSGLSSAVGCGRHGEDAWAGLEVCVYVPAGVLQGSGDEGPG